MLRQVLFDIRAGNSNLEKSLGKKRNHAMYQDENPHRGLLYPCKINKTNHFSPILVHYLNTQTWFFLIIEIYMGFPYIPEAVFSFLPKC